MKVGSIVKVKASFLGNPENMRGYVYELYPDFDDKTKSGICIILENGSDLGGFSAEEQVQYVEHLSDTDINYEHKNSWTLSNDFESKIKQAFTQN